MINRRIKKQQNISPLPSSQVFPEHQNETAETNPILLSTIMSESVFNPEKEKINLETSLINWTALQRFFAGGLAISVSADLDLIETACQFSQDNKVLVQQWIDEEKISHVSDNQARQWFDNNSLVWAVVVKPWVLVQETKAGE